MIMSDENSLPNPYFPDEEGFLGVDVNALAQGRRVEAWNPASFLRSGKPENDGPPNDVVFVGRPMIPAFSRRLQQSLVANRVGVGDMQYLPVTLRRSTGEEIYGFTIANVLTRLAALDRERCYLIVPSIDEEIDPATGLTRIAAIGKLAIWAGRLAGHDVARLEEYQSVAVLVSQRFVNVFNRGRFTGVTFSPVIQS